MYTLFTVITCKPRHLQPLSIQLEDGQEHLIFVCGMCLGIKDSKTFWAIIRVMFQCNKFISYLMWITTAYFIFLILISFIQARSIVIALYQVFSNINSIFYFDTYPVWWSRSHKTKRISTSNGVIWDIIWAEWRNSSEIG